MFFHLLKRRPCYRNTLKFTSSQLGELQGNFETADATYIGLSSRHLVLLTLSDYIAIFPVWATKLSYFHSRYKLIYYLQMALQQTLVSFMQFLDTFESNDSLKRKQRQTVYCSLHELMIIYLLEILQQN